MTATLSPEARPADGRIGQLNRVSARRVIDPETFAWGTMRPGAVLGRDLLSVKDLDLDIPHDALDRLSREEAASMLATGLRFGAALPAGRALQIAEPPEHP